MKQISKNLSFRPLLLGVGTVLGLTILSGVAMSYDPAASFRNQPGFRCLYQNNRGECLDFVFDSNTRRSSSSRSSTSHSNRSDRDIVEGDRITVELEAEDDEVRRGDIVEYTIRLTNDTNRRIETSVTANLDTDMIFSSASDRGRNRSSRRIEWDDVSIRADGEEELTFRVRISSNARSGDELDVSVETDDTDDEAEVTIEVIGSSSSNNDDDDCEVVYIINGRRVESRSARCNDDDDDDDDGDFLISISDSPDPFEPGELVSYTITVRNLDNRSRTFDARAELDDEVNFISGSDNVDEQSDNDLEWENLSVGSNGSRTLTVVVRTERDLDDGDIINFTFEADGSEDSEETEAEFN